MKIAVLQASTQKDKNALLETCVKRAAGTGRNEVINFGIFPEETMTFSYIQTALCISLLLESKSVDFVVTGCSSGQGMMLACNSLPGILCGYVSNPSDAYLFGRINDGNAISYPLGLNFGWAAEINLQNTLDRLFDEPFGIGYPKEQAARKRQDTIILKKINAATKKRLTDVLPLLDQAFVKSVLQRDCVYQYVIQNSQNKHLKEILQSYRQR